MVSTRAKEVILFIAFLTLVGCATAAREMTTNTPIQEAGAPEWVVKGSGAFGGERGRAFYEVGSASGIQDPSLLREVADNRARAAIAMRFDSRMAILLKDYFASTRAGDVKVTAEEQLVERVVKTVTARTLSGVEIVDHWQHPGTGQLFALARMDLQAFQDSLEKVKELDAKVKEYIRQNAERLHQELEKEAAKKKVEEAD